MEKASGYTRTISGKVVILILLAQFIMGMIGGALTVKMYCNFYYETYHQCLYCKLYGENTARKTGFISRVKPEETLFKKSGRSSDLPQLMK
ncbi:MAG: hypothetical protein AAB503_01200 [Patescibacteria group bacterium]